MTCHRYKYCELKTFNRRLRRFHDRCRAAVESESAQMLLLLISAFPFDSLTTRRPAEVKVGGEAAAAAVEAAVAAVIFRGLPELL